MVDAGYANSTIETKIRRAWCAPHFPDISTRQVFELSAGQDISDTAICCADQDEQRNARRCGDAERARPVTNRFATARAA